MPFSAGCLPTAAASRPPEAEGLASARATQSERGWRFPECDPHARDDMKMKTCGRCTSRCAVARRSRPHPQKEGMAYRDLSVQSFRFKFTRVICVISVLKLFSSRPPNTAEKTRAADRCKIYIAVGNRAGGHARAQAGTGGHVRARARSTLRRGTSRTHGKTADGLRPTPTRIGKVAAQCAR